MTEKGNILPHEPLSEESRKTIENCFSTVRRDRIGQRYRFCFNGIEIYYKTHGWLSDKQIAALERITQFTLYEGNQKARHGGKSRWFGQW